MKRKILGFIGLGCGVLLLTGCGGSAHTLSCEYEDEDEGYYENFDLKFNDDETEPESAKIEMTYVAPSGTSNEEMEEARKSLEATYCSLYDECKVKISGDKVTISVSSDVEKLNGVKKQSLEKYKEELENEGYSCK